MLQYAQTHTFGGGDELTCVTIRTDTPSRGDELTCVTTRTDTHLLGTHLPLLYRFSGLWSDAVFFEKIGLMLDGILLKSLIFAGTFSLFVEPAIWFFVTSLFYRHHSVFTARNHNHLYMSGI